MNVPLIALENHLMQVLSYELSNILKYSNVSTANESNSMISLELMGKEQEEVEID